MPDAARPGFKHMIIHPEPGGLITYAKADYDSIRGRISSHWKLDKDAFRVELKIPANTSATVYIPAESPERVKESGRPASQADGVRFIKMDGSLAVFEVGSGSYRFVAAAGGAASRPKR
jgi:alpha-L-rhamnosidase